MADWEKVVTAYDTVDKAKAALNVLKTSGIDTSNVSLLDRSALGETSDYAHVHCGAVCSVTTFGNTRRPYMVTPSRKAARCSLFVCPRIR